MTTARIWLRARRAELEQTQQEAAKDCAVSVQTWHRWETHNLIPTLAQAVEIVRLH